MVCLKVQESRNRIGCRKLIFKINDLEPFAYALTYSDFYSASFNFNARTLAFSHDVSQHCTLTQAQERRRKEFVEFLKVGAQFCGV